MPVRNVEAGLLSALFADEALAAPSPNTAKSLSTDTNSQNISLLQANVSSFSMIQEKSTKNDKQKDSQAGPVDPNADVSIVSDNAILPATGPLGVSDGKDIIDPTTQETSVYVVRKGDTVTQIADLFGVSVSTILSANDLKKGQKLVEGDVLLILPISGVEHTVTKGQTLQSIAKMYKVDVDEIMAYNAIDEGGKIAIGDELIIPGGEMYDEGGDKPAANLSSAVAKDKNYYATHPIQNLVGYFLNPLPTGHKTQGLHGPGNRGIDIGAPTGTPLYASAGGTVLITKTGCKVGRSSCGGGYGNMAIIQHPNGTKTLYAHMSKVATTIGAKVSQGEIIGYVGSTGHSTGPHVHFEVFNAKNPGSDWSWAR